MSEKYKNLKVKELQELLQKNNLPYSGKKEDLIDRLVKNDEREALENLEKEFELDDDLDDSKINLNDIPQDIFTPIPLEKAPTISEKESVLSDDEEVEFIINKKSLATAGTPKEKHVATANITKSVDKPSKQVSISTKVTTSGSKDISNSTDSTTATVTTTATTTATTAATSFKFTPITFDKKSTSNVPTVSSTTTAPEKKLTTSKKKSVVPQTDEAAEKLRLEAERRLLRSKRFGVKLDEKEMKEIRAARFGITTTTTTATDEKTNEAATKAEKTKKNSKTSSKPLTQEEILKKRAERFGLPVVNEKKQVVVDEKKKIKSKKGNKKIIAPEVKKTNPIIITKRKAAKVTKKIAAPPISNKKQAITLKTTTRANLRKQKMMKKMIEKADIVKDKKKIIHQRKANIINASAKQSGRIVTYETNPIAPVTATKKRNAPKTNNTKAPARNIVVQHNNDRKVVIADAVPQKTGGRNNNNSATRKRGRGSEKEQPHPQPTEIHTNKKRRR